MAGRSATDDRLGQNAPSPEAEPDDENAQGQAAGDVELLWANRQLSRMHLFYDATCRTLHKWLNRRSQRRSMTWPALNRMLVPFHVPKPRIVEKTNQRMPCQKDLSFCQRLLDFPAAQDYPDGECESELTLRARRGNTARRDL